MDLAPEMPEAILAVENGEDHKGGGGAPVLLTILSRPHRDRFKGLRD